MKKLRSERLIGPPVLTTRQLYGCLSAQGTEDVAPIEGASPRKKLCRAKHFWPLRWHLEDHAVTSILLLPRRIYMTSAYPKRAGVVQHFSWRGLHASMHSRVGAG